MRGSEPGEIVPASNGTGPPAGARGEREDRIAALFRVHHEALCRYLYRFTGDEDIAVDAAQDAFLRLIEQPPAPGSERAWLFRVATNAAIDAARRRSRRRRLAVAAAARLPHSDPPPSPDAAVEGDERVRIARAALTGLSEKERSALLMRAEGFKQKEIAGALGTTTQSVGTLVARALRKMAARLAPGSEDA